MKRIAVVRQPDGLGSVYEIEGASFAIRLKTTVLFIGTFIEACSFAHQMQAEDVHIKSYRCWREGNVAKSEWQVDDFNIHTEIHK